MHITPERRQEASDYCLAVRNASTRAIAELPPPEHLDFATAVTASIGGLIAAIAIHAEASGVAPTKADKRRLADECRTALLKAMASARNDLDNSRAFTAH